MIINGDSAVVLRGIRDDSVDLVLTDPPYMLTSSDRYSGSNISRENWLREDDGKTVMGRFAKKAAGGFMNKGWDGELPPPEIWAECYRILKPGAYILVFASPRNDDLVSIALREAGFIKHNKIPHFYWLFGSGFPKGTDVSKAIDRRAVLDWLRGKEHGLTLAQIRKVVSAAVNGEYFPDSHRETDGQLAIKSQANARERRSEGTRLITRLEERFGEMPKRVKVGEKRVGIGKRLGKTDIEGSIFLNSIPETEKHIPETAPATPEAADWEGYKYGLQSLKPAVETILVFQKPFDGRPLDSIRKWRVGAVNVDAGRIGITDYDENYYIPKRIGYKAGKNHIVKTQPKRIDNKWLWDLDKVGESTMSWSKKGRYPANVVFSHTPFCRREGVRRVRGQVGRPNCYGKQYKSNLYGNGKCGMKSLADPDGRETVPQYRCAPGCPVAELDRQSGYSPSNARVNKPHRTVKGNWVYSGHWEPQDKPFTINDTGTASRFFYQAEYGEPDAPFYYCAKSSRVERNSGVYFDGLLCEVIRHKLNNGLSHVHTSWDKSERKAYISCLHPTVKPVNLLRYLIGIYAGNSETPIIVDPFCGSGSTNVAASLAGCKCIGIDAEMEYCQIANGREIYWTNPEVISAYLNEGKYPAKREELPLFE